MMATDLRPGEMIESVSLPKRAPSTGCAFREIGRRHGDFAIGLALAHFASRMRWVEYGYQAVPRVTDHAPGQMRDLPDEDDAAPGWWRSPLGAGLRGGI